LSRWLLDGEGAQISSVNLINVAKPVRGTVLGGKVALSMIRGVIDLAKTSDAQMILFHVSSSEHIDKTDRFFGKMGLTGLGRNYDHTL
jgi:hypothetical protein